MRIPSLATILVLSAAAARASEEGRTVLVSIGHDGTLPVLGSDSPRISADGRFVAFTSHAASIVPGDQNGVADVFVRDLWAAVSTRVSVSSEGAEANGPSFVDHISPDGRWVTFTSDATNLVAGDTNGASDVFVHDRESGTTVRASLGKDGAAPSGPSLNGSLSQDARLVAFASDASDVVEGDTNGKRDVFVRDLESGETRRVSVGPDGAEANGTSQVPAISRNGRFVTFSSYATNLVEGDGNKRSDVFVHDLGTGRTALVSVGPDGARGDGSSFFSAISADGRFVAFQSLATNLVEGDTNAHDDIFVHDRETGGTERVSLDSAGAESSGAPELVTASPQISGDGRSVAFHSNLDRLVEDDTNEDSDVFVHDRESGDTICASVASSGRQGNRASHSAALSDDARFVAFASGAPNLIAGSGAPKVKREDPATDVYVRERYETLGAAFCFGDGSDTACPCGNPGGFDEGCANSTGRGGFLTAIGSCGVAADDLVLVAARLPPGCAATLLVGDAKQKNGQPLQDGLGCVRGSIVRLEVRQAGADGIVTFGPGLARVGGWGAGTTRQFQVWYSDPAGPCGSGDNQTNAFEIVFAP